MANLIQGTQEGSLVHRFITSGKQGYCELCNKWVEKLEAHHIKYSPERIIKACHECHHKTHFWPNRLTEKEKFKILKKVHPIVIAEELSKFKFASVSDLAKIIAPSRSEFIHAAQRIEQARIENKEKDKKQLRPEKSDVLKAIREIPRLSEPQKIKKKNI